MTGPAARHDEHDVETEIEIGEMRITAEQMRGGALQPALLARQQRFCRRTALSARLYFDDSEGTSAADDEIDLARRGFQAARDDAVTLEPEEKHGQRFGAKAEAVSGEAGGGIALAGSAGSEPLGLHFAPDNSSARA